MGCWLLLVMHTAQPTTLLGDRLVPPRVVAGLLRVHRNTLHKYAARGELTPIYLSSRCTRYRMSDVEAFIARRQATSADDA